MNGTTTTKEQIAKRIVVLSTRSDYQADLKRWKIPDWFAGTLQSPIVHPEDPSLVLTSFAVDMDSGPQANPEIRVELGFTRMGVDTGGAVG